MVEKFVLNACKASNFGFSCWPLKKGAALRLVRSQTRAIEACSSSELRVELLAGHLSLAETVPSVGMSTRDNLPLVGSVAQCCLLAPQRQRSLKMKDDDLDAKLLNLGMSSWFFDSAFRRLRLGGGKEDLGCSDKKN